MAVVNFFFLETLPERLRRIRLTRTMGRGYTRWQSQFLTVANGLAFPSTRKDAREVFFFFPPTSACFLSVVLAASQI